MSTASRFLGVGVALGLGAGLLVGVGLTQPGRAAAAAPSAAPSVLSAGTVTVAPGVPATTTVTTGGTTVAQSGTAIAYPYFAGSPGVAPDHTIVVTGVGQADLQSDGSNQAATQKSALTAALADAKAQADVIAAGTGLTISGVLSVSASVSPGYGVVPMVANGAVTPSCVEPVPMPVPGRGPVASGVTVAPQPACVPTYQQSLSVSVTVEYRVG